ncbi:hypothetical protein SSPO_061340 [Streptomyces antimycoticus]|uniref:Uncharacterized protein n=1 Tax=Streptomyces antimycoticus TaxID=68175 RepID=A0A499V525_9ACTN|nr:hypothetical protein SSPO_061340 [Streptomyces antimycoticus]
MTPRDPHDADAAVTDSAALPPQASPLPPEPHDGDLALDLDLGPEGGGDTGDTVLGRRYRALTLGIVTVVSLIAFEASAVNTAMPVAARALDGVELYAYAFSAYFTASLFAMALSGSGATARGRWRRCSRGSRRSPPGCWWPVRHSRCGCSWAGARCRA